MNDIDDWQADEAVRRIFPGVNNSPEQSDLLFLATWERRHPANLGAVLRAGQIRRANPELAAAVNKALKRAKAPPDVV